MAFEPVSAHTPTEIGAIHVELITTPDPENPGEVIEEVYYRVVIRDQYNVDYYVETGSLVPHLTQAQIDGLRAFMADMRTLAQGFLPAP